MNTLAALKKKSGMSERELASRCGLSRATVRSVLAGKKSVTLESIARVCKTLKVQEPIIPAVTRANSDDSALVATLRTTTDNQWKLHFFNFIDAFRRTRDPLLVAFPPTTDTPEKYMALMAATVCSLCDELSIVKPTWAKRGYWLKEPWFVSGFESLKATALVESPAYFRRNNIFVLSNFLSRA